LLAACSSLGYRSVALMTNGTTLRGRARTWRTWGLREVVAPLYSLDADLHDQICGMSCWQKAWDGLREAQDEGVQVQIHTLFLQETMEGLPALAEEVRRTFGERLAVGLLRPKPGFSHSAHAPHLSRIREILASIPEDYCPELLMAPLCLASGDGAGLRAGAWPAVTPRSLLAQLYFSTQSRHYSAICGECPSRANCPGLVDGYPEGIPA
jgi:hypothetical protein